MMSHVVDVEWVNTGRTQWSHRRHRHFLPCATADFELSEHAMMAKRPCDYTYPSSTRITPSWVMR